MNNHVNRFASLGIHSYRFDFGLAEGDPALAELEAKLAKKPHIVVPAITLDGRLDPLKPGGIANHALLFPGMSIALFNEDTISHGKLHRTSPMRLSMFNAGVLACNCGVE